MNFLQVTALIIAIFTTCIVKEVRSINCFQCNSHNTTQEDCVNLIDRNNNTMLYPKPCIGDYNGLQPFCRKTIITVFSKTGEQEVRTYRGCGWVKHKNPCYKADNEAHAERSCQCFENACNSALHQSSVSRNLFAFIIFFAGFVYSYNK